MEHQSSDPFGSRELTEEEQKALVALRHTYARTETLLALPEFRWFLAECVQAKHDEAQRDALDTDKTPEERDRAAHVRKAIAEIRDWTTRMRDGARSVIQG